MMTAETGTTSLVDVLVSIGVDITKAGEREIQGRCPVHESRTGRADKSPSWSMNASTGAWICFSCGARGSLIGLVKELTGSDDPALEYYSIIANNELAKAHMPKVAHRVAADWVSYERFPSVPSECLELRNISEESARLHGIKWSPEDECWIIPIVTQDRELLGWQSKRPGWIRNFPVGVKKSETLFGIERFRGGTAILVESPLDVVRLTSMNCGYQGLATFGTAVSNAQINILSHTVERLIVAMDNDDAGVKSAKKLFQSLPRFRKGTLWVNYKGTTAKDIGEMTDDEIKTLIDTASVIPGWVL